MNRINIIAQDNEAGIYSAIREFEKGVNNSIINQTKPIYPRSRLDEENIAFCF